MEPQDREVLASIFAARVGLAKKTEEQAARDAMEEHRRTLAWIASNKTGEGSFVWFCEEFDLDIGSVRTAIKEKR